MGGEGNEEADYLAKNAAHEDKVDIVLQYDLRIRIHFNHKQVSQRNVAEVLLNTGNSGKSKNQFCLQKKRLNDHNQVEAQGLWA